MLERVFHWLWGYAEFEVDGDAARFLNVCAKQGFRFWGFGRRDGKAVLRCRVGEYKRLRPAVRRCRVRVRCVQKKGAPFQLLRVRRRKGLVLGAVCGLGLYFFLAGFIWGVSVTGTENLTDRQVLDAARASGVYPGAPKRTLLPKLAEHGITGRLPQLKWVSVNNDGCYVEVAVGEKEERLEAGSTAQWSNIVAARAGTVRAIATELGRPEVAAGDTVEAGDLLISGLYQEIPDPYGVQPEHPLQVAGAARGSVIAETYREFTVEASAQRTEAVPTGERREFAVLHLFSLEIPLGLHVEPKEAHWEFTQITTLHALGRELPVALEKRVAVFTEERTRTLDEASLKEAALLQLREAQRAAVPAGGRIVSEELDYRFADGRCILSAKCRVEEEIGVLQEISVN